MGRRGWDARGELCPPFPERSTEMPGEVRNEKPDLVAMMRALRAHAKNLKVPYPPKKQ